MLSEGARSWLMDGTRRLLSDGRRPSPDGCRRPVIDGDRIAPRLLDELWRPVMEGVRKCAMLVEDEARRPGRPGSGRPGWADAVPRGPPAPENDGGRAPESEAGRWPSSSIPLLFRRWCSAAATDTGMAGAPLSTAPPVPPVPPVLADMPPDDPAAWARCGGSATLPDDLPRFGGRGAPPVPLLPPASVPDPDSLPGGPESLCPNLGPMELAAAE